MLNNCRNHRNSDSHRMGFMSGGNSTNNLLAGIFIIVLGVLLFAKQSMELPFPKWFFSWPMILVAIGLFVGIRDNFKGPSWWIMFLVASPFLAKKMFPEYNLAPYIWPSAIIVVGLIVVLTASKSKKQSTIDTKDSFDGIGSTASDTDLIESVSVFGGAKKRIISKNFRGGEVTNIFGGTDIDLSNADLQSPASLEITCIFGGCKIIVPSDWMIKTETTNIFGGIEDKTRQNQTEPQKILYLRGTILFGGIDIKNY